MMKMLETFAPQMLIMVMCYLAHIVFVFADYRSGVIKAKKAGQIIISNKQRRSINKGAIYILVLLGFNIVDFMQMIAIRTLNSEFDARFWILPFFSILITILNCLIEFKSIRETREEKEKVIEEKTKKELKQIVDYILANKSKL